MRSRSAIHDSPSAGLPVALRRAASTCSAARWTFRKPSTSRPVDSAAEVSCAAVCSRALALPRQRITAASARTGSTMASSSSRANSGSSARPWRCGSWAACEDIAGHATQASWSRPQQRWRSLHPGQCHAGRGHGSWTGPAKTIPGGQRYGQPGRARQRMRFPACGSCPTRRVARAPGATLRTQRPSGGVAARTVPRCRRPSTAA